MDLKKTIPTEINRLVRLALPPAPPRAKARRRRHPAPELLRGAIATVRRKRVVVSVAHGVLVVALTLLSLLAAEMLFDWLIGFPWLGRLALFVIGLSVVSALAWRDIFLPAARKADDDTVALMIEKAMPVFESRFIAALQLSGDHGGGAKAPMLVRALVSETESMARSLSFRYVVSTARLRKLALIALAALVAGGGLFWLFRPASEVLLRRAFLSTEPVPRKTQILNPTGSRTIAIGSDITIEADAGGVIPSVGRVRLVSDSGKKSEFSLEPDAERRTHFSRTIASVQEPFSYVIELNDAESEEFKIDISLPPAVAELELRQEYPPYALLAGVERKVSELSLLAGSTLAVNATATRPISSARLRLAGLDQTVPMRVDPADPRKVTGAFRVPAEKLTGFSIELVDAGGIASQNEPVYRIDVVPDQPPRVAMVLPERREMLVTQAGTLLIAFRAEDDFGVARVRLHYAVNPKPETPPETRVLEFNLGGVERKIARRFQWKVASANPPPIEGDTIEYWIEAVDSNNVTGPGTARTETAAIKVVSESEKRLDLANRLNDTVSGLNEVTRTQSELNEDIGQIIFARPE